ncbi:MAG: hypothetical protein ACFB0G_00990 [Leptolyngbyaceae cyanobacterium]
MRRRPLRNLLLELLAAALGAGILVGETLDQPAIASNDDDGGQFPDQRIGGGTHFRERIGRAKLLGQLPGLRAMATKLRQPRTGSVLAAYTPDPNQQPPGGPIAEGKGKNDDDNRGAGVSGVRG